MGTRQHHDMTHHHNYVLDTLCGQQLALKGHSTGEPQRRVQNGVTIDPGIKHMKSLPGRKARQKQTQHVQRLTTNKPAIT